MNGEQDTRDFVEALLGSAPDDHWILFWTLQDKLSHWERIDSGPEALTAKIGQLVPGNDVYISVAVAESPFGPNRRIGAGDAAGIPGLWADIDIAHPDVHKRWNLPPSEEAARELLAAVGLPPSVVVHSGHGLQAWWLFEEFWTFDDEEARQSAGQLAQAWNTTLQVRASERNWVIDSTFDLARVMRIPGTINRKGGDEVPVRLLEGNELRYSQQDFEERMVDETVLAQLGLTPQSSYIVDQGLTLAPQATPPFEKFQALCQAEPNFQKSWDRNRSTRDLPDQSPSSYDLSLASYAASVGWTDQEIADLIIASRRHHHDDLKLRVDYYRRTIAKAHESMARVNGADMIEEVADELIEARTTGDDEMVREKRRSVLETVSSQFGIEVVRVIKFKSTPPSYRIVTPTGGINIGSAQEMLNQNAMRACIAGETAHLIERFRGNDWDRLLRVMFQAAEEQDVGMESTEAGQIYVWVSDYILARRPVDSIEEAAISMHPYTVDEETCIFAGHFKQWLWLSRGERVSAKDIGRMLRLFGCTPRQISVPNDDGSTTTRQVWQLPPSGNWSV